MEKRTVPFSRKDNNMICNICKKNPAVIFSSKEVNGKREMEGLCIDCAKKQGINTDEILRAQNSNPAGNINMNNMNNQLEGLFKNLAESLGNIDGIEFDAMAFPDMMNGMNNSEFAEEDDEYDSFGDGFKKEREMLVSMTHIDAYRKMFCRTGVS